MLFVKFVQVFTDIMIAAIFIRAPDVVGDQRPA